MMRSPPISINLEEAIQDDFECLLFKDHPIGQNILGTPETVAKLNGTDINDFIVQNYNTSEMVFAVFGDYDFKKVVKLFEKYFGAVPVNNNKKQREIPQKTSLVTIFLRNLLLKHTALLATRLIHHPIAIKAVCFC